MMSSGSIRPLDRAHDVHCLSPCSATRKSILAASILANEHTAAENRRRDPVKPDRHLRDYAAPPSRGKQRAMVSDAAAVRVAAVRTWFQVVQLVRSEEEEVRAVISQVRHLNVPSQ